MGITGIHIEDYDMMRRIVARTVASQRPSWEWRSFDGASVELAVEAIREAVFRGQAIVYVSDRDIEKPYSTGEAFWRDLWDKLSAEERRAITHFVAYCSPDGFPSLLQGVAVTEGFSGTVISVPKPKSAADLLGFLPP